MLNIDLFIFTIDDAINRSIGMDVLGTPGLEEFHTHICWFTPPLCVQTVKGHKQTHTQPPTRVDGRI